MSKPLLLKLFLISTILAFAADKPAEVTVEGAVAEAIQNNPALLAERLRIAVAETAAITAALRPNPVVSSSSDHLDWLGTGYNDINGAGPVESAVRVDVPLERGRKRQLRMSTAGFATEIARAHLADSTRRLRADVTLACVDVMEAKARLALSRENLQSLEGIVQLNQVRLTSGAIAPVELK